MAAQKWNTVLSVGGLVCVCVCVCVYDAVTKNGFDEAWARLGRWEELREGRVRGSQL